jgi:hypothetical protein
VELQGLAADMGFQRILGVGQRRQFEIHSNLLGVLFAS